MATRAERLASVAATIHDYRAGEIPTSTPEHVHLAKLDPYGAYRDSGVPWLGNVPAHWDLSPLKALSQVRLSGVDRQLVAHEERALFVGTETAYATERIDSKTPLPAASVTPHEFSRFRLLRGDVVLTKDSLVPTRIAVPALVDEPPRRAVCGYHLALVRPLDHRALGPYIFRLLSTPLMQSYFLSLAKGTTIIGLGRTEISRAPLLCPPLAEQAAIVQFLDHADRRIGRYVQAKQRLIALLEEQKQAIIYRAVTRGLDPDVRLKPSGVEWLGDIPEHWEVRRAKWLYREVDERSATGEQELLSVSHTTGVTPRSQKTITMFMAESYVGHKICRPDDLVINTMWAWMGALGVSRHVGLVSPGYAVYRPSRRSGLLPKFAELLLKTRLYVAEFLIRSTGIHSSRLRLYPEQFLRIPVLRPPVDDQRVIIDHIKRETEELERATQAARSEIELLREYRARLTVDVVTGKLDVRAAAAELPDELDEADGREGLGALFEGATENDIEAAPQESRV